MQICDNGIIRDMTEAEENIANNLPDPHDQVLDVDKAEAYDILVGVSE